MTAGIDEKIAALHHRVRRLAFNLYLRKGAVPVYLAEIMEATATREAFIKYNPDWENQPRVPAGEEGGGQWTDGGGGGGTKPDSAGSGQDAQGNDEPHPNIDDLLYLLESVVMLLPQGRFLRMWGAFRIGRNTTWVLGTHKSAKTWANQIKKRDWTPEDITETIAKGKRFPAPNLVNRANRASRYENQRTGNYLVIDEKTRHILQLGDKKFFRQVK